MKRIIFCSVFLLSSSILFLNCTQSKGNKQDVKTHPPPALAGQTNDTVSNQKVVSPPIDKKLYDSLMKRLAHGDTSGKWPVKNTPYPLPGAILPFKRVVAFYGNLFSKKMGILGDIPP